MAFTYTNAIKAHTHITGTIKPVALALADRANDTGKCWPSINTLSDDTGFSTSTIKRGIRTLESLGYLRVEYRKRWNGSQASNLYTLNLEAFTSTAKKAVQAVKRGFSKAVEMGKEFVSDTVKPVKLTTSRIGVEAWLKLPEAGQQIVIDRLKNKKNATLQQQLDQYGLASGYVQKALFNEVQQFNREQKKHRTSTHKTTIEKLTDRSWADNLDQYNEFGVRISDSVLEA